MAVKGAPRRERIRIRGGRVIDPANGVDQVMDVYIAAGRIAGLGDAPDGFSAERSIDATGLIVCPGLVDLCARMREPGLEHKATIASETRAAVAGGITTLCCPPDTDPIIDTTAVIELIRRRAEQAGFARVVALGALTRGLNGEQLSEMAALKRFGCVGVGNTIHPKENPLVLRRAMEYAATHDLTVFLYPEDTALSDGGCVHEGAISTRLGLPGIPEAAETAAVARDLALIEHTGVRSHFCRLSTARAVQMVGRAQYDGLPVTADVAMHQLFLTEHDITGFDSECHVLPPLRTERDRDGLRQGVARGVIGALCSDHQPHERDAKRAPFIETEPGLSGLETLLPLALKLVHEGLLDFSQALARLTYRPARILNIDTGTLGMKARADVCVFDPDLVWRYDHASMLSQGRNTPFLGWEFKGRARYTMMDGRLVHEL
jgi:dihydroorotase